eukprot:5241084-Prymnesium_polylepis.1
MLSGAIPGNLTHCVRRVPLRWLASSYRLYGSCPRFRSRAHGLEMRWGVRYAEDADHGDPVADMADEFH